MVDEVTIDLSKYKDRMGQRVMPGRYAVLVEDVEPDTSNQGNPMINVWYRIMGGEFDGSTLVDRLVLTDKSLFRVVGFMQAIGLPTPKKRLKVNVRLWVNKMLEVDVEDGEPYNGRVKSEVRGYMRYIGGRQGSAAKEETDLTEDLDGLDEFASETTQNPVAETDGEPEEREELQPEQVTQRLADQADTEDLVEEEIDLDQLKL